MLQAWLDRRRRSQLRRAAADLEAWSDTAQAILDACQEPLRAPRLAADIGVVLDRVDRLLMRFRNEFASARSALRGRPELAVRVRRATDGLVRLRNDTCAFLLRARASQQLDDQGVVSIDARRNMDESRLQASRSARGMASELASLRPQIDGVVHELQRASEAVPKAD